jgi:hypothetical protein
MQDTANMTRKPDGGTPAPRPLVDEELADHLLGKAQAEGVELLGPEWRRRRVPALHGPLPAGGRHLSPDPGDRRYWCLGFPG